MLPETGLAVGSGHVAVGRRGQRLWTGIELGSDALELQADEAWAPRLAAGITPSAPNLDVKFESEAGLWEADDAAVDVQVWLRRLRKMWVEIPREEISRRTCLAIVQGIVERADPIPLEGASAWLQRTWVALRESSAAAPAEVESSARELRCGLPVLDAERDPTCVDAVFGVVQRVEAGEVHLSMLVRQTENDPTGALWEGCVAPVVDLPTAYASEGAGIAWVDRTYDCSGALVRKGRFEPASSLSLAEV